MDQIDDEVYSEVDFHQEGTNKKSNESIEDDYIEDEFEESAKAIDAEETKYARNALTPDLGSVGKVAKKEGVFEVVEDDHHEKAPSCGSQYSEISVKDESEEGTNNGTDAQIFLDDQSDTQTEHPMQLSQPGAVKQIISSEASERNSLAMNENSHRPLSMMADQHTEVISAVNQLVSLRNNPDEETKMEPEQTSQTLTQFRNNSNIVVSASASVLIESKIREKNKCDAPQLARAEPTNKTIHVTERTSQLQSLPGAFQTAEELMKSSDLNKVETEKTASIKQINDEMMTSQGRVVSMGEEKDMFDFQLASTDQQKQRRQDEQIVSGELVNSQTASSNQSEVVAASSGAMPETFRDDSQSSSNSKKVDKVLIKIPQGVAAPNNWQKRNNNKGLRAPRSDVQNLKVMHSSNNASRPGGTVASNTTGLFKSRQTSAFSGQSNFNKNLKPAEAKAQQLSLNRQESEQTYGISKTLDAAAQSSSKLIKSSTQKPPWGGGQGIKGSNPAAQPKSRIQTAVQLKQATEVPQPPPNYPLRPLKTSNGARQQSAFNKFVNRGSSSVNRNSAAFSKSNNTTRPSGGANSKFYPGVGMSSTSKFVNPQTSQPRGGARSVRPNTSAIMGGNPNRQSSNQILPKSVHNGVNSQQRRDIRNRQMLQSANVKVPEHQRVTSQKQIKVPQSSYGVKPAATYGNYVRKSSAVSRGFTSTESLNKEKSVRKLRMGNYMGGNSALSHSQSNFRSASKTSQHHPQHRSASRQSNKAGLAVGKSQSQNRNMMSASKMDSRASLLETSFQGVKQFPTLDFKGDEDFALKILDNMIQVEEDMTAGFSMYNRGKNLKKSLINPDRVKEYLQKLEKEKEEKNLTADQLISLEDQSEGSESNKLALIEMPSIPDPAGFVTQQKRRNQPPDLLFLKDNVIDEDKQWRLMLDYFKKNPDALMDAIPTPPGEEEDKEALKDFRTGLTPKKGFSFKFGGNEKSYNRPSYIDRRQGSFDGNTSQMSARSTGSRGAGKIYNQSPRVGSARSYHSRLSTSGAGGRDNNTRYSGSQQRVNLNRSYSSNMNASFSQKNQNQNQNRASARKSNNAYDSRQSHNSRSHQALNKSTSSIGSTQYGGGAAGGQARRQPSNIAGTNNGGGAYANRQSSSARKNNALLESSQKSSRSIKQQRDFRITKPTPKNQTTGNQVANRLQQKQQEEKKQHESKRQHTDRMRNMLKKKDKDSSQTASVHHQQQQQVPGSLNQSSIASIPFGKKSNNQSSSKTTIVSNMNSTKVLAAKLQNQKERLNLEYIDWKESYFYRQQILRHIEDSQKWESADLIHEEEHEFFTKQIRAYRMKRPGFNADELLKLTPIMTSKCYNTIKMIYREILTESYWRQEYDAMLLNDPCVARTIPRGHTSQALRVITLDNLINRINVLKQFRRDIRTFLEVVHQREMLLKQMHLVVESIQSETFFFSEADLEARKAFATDHEDKSKIEAERNSQQNPRHEMQTMGNNLVDLTDQIIKGVIKFFKNFNKQFSHVKLEQFIFQEADYIDVAMKEVEEISQIFTQYEITIKPLHNSQLYVRPATNQFANKDLKLIKQHFQQKGQSGKNEDVASSSGVASEATPLGASSSSIAPLQ